MRNLFNVGIVPVLLTKVAFQVADQELAPLLVASAPQYHNLLTEEGRERVLRGALESFFKGTARRLRAEDVASWASRLSATSVGSVLTNEGSKTHVSFSNELVRSVFDFGEEVRASSCDSSKCALSRVFRFIRILWQIKAQYTGLLEENQKNYVRFPLPGFRKSS